MEFCTVQCFIFIPFTSSEHRAPKIHQHHWTNSISFSHMKLTQINLILFFPVANSPNAVNTYRLVLMVKCFICFNVIRTFILKNQVDKRAHRQYEMCNVNNARRVHWVHCFQVKPKQSLLSFSFLVLIYVNTTSTINEIEIMITEYPIEELQCKCKCWYVVVNCLSRREKRKRNCIKHY